MEACAVEWDAELALWVDREHASERNGVVEGWAVSSWMGARYLHSHGLSYTLMA